MSCPPDPATFRLLDALVGWDPANIEGLVGENDTDGITLAPLGEGLSASAIGHALPPAWLAKACDPCRWLLVTCCPPQSRLLVRDSCSSDWRKLWSGPCAAGELVCASAIAVHEDLIAVSDPGAGEVRVWRAQGRHHAYDLPIAQPGPLCWAGRKGWMVCDLATMQLRLFDRSGAERGVRAQLPGTPDRIGADKQGGIWLATSESGHFRLWVLAREDVHFRPTSLIALTRAFAETGIETGEAGGFCLIEEIDGVPQQSCFDCHGRPIAPPACSDKPRWHKRGQLLTLAIDSGIPRCRWHRLRLDADIPAGTAVAVSLATSEDPSPAPQAAPTIAGGEWSGFASGLPHPDDWTGGPDKAVDFLIDQPTGRYLFVRVRLSGNGLATPRLRRVRIDMPRQTSFSLLPAVYTDNPGATDFGERFMALFDAAVEGMDRVIERYPALFDVDGAPPELLPWLGNFLGVAMDTGWTEAQRRAVLKAMPDLFRLRGTPEGLARAVELVLGTRPAVREATAERAWGAVGSAQLGSLRLFGRSSSRFRLGRSGVGRAPVWSLGNPDRDPLTAQAWRFDVLLPMTTDGDVRRQVEQVIASQKPAHTVANIRQGAQGLVIGAGLAVGIDTALVPLPPPVLSSSAGVRLGRQSILWPRHRSTGPALRVGREAIAGVTTVME